MTALTQLQTNKTALNRTRIVTSSLAPLSYGTMEGFVAIAGFQRVRACERIRGAQLRCLAGEGDACAALQGDPFAPRLPRSPSGSAPRP